MTASQIIAVASGRGGSGKTTLAYALGFLLHTDYKADVALLDLDPQGGLTNLAGQPFARNVFADHPIALDNGMLLYASGRTLYGATAEVLRPHVERAASVEGRFVIADMAPALTDAAHDLVMTTGNTLVLVVCRLELASIPYATQTIEKCKAAGCPYRVIGTFNKKRLSADTTLMALEQLGGEQMIHVIVPEDVKAADAISRRQPVPVFAPKARASEAYRGILTALFAEEGAA